MIAFPELPQPGPCATSRSTRAYLDTPLGRLHVELTQLVGHIPDAPLRLTLTYEPADDTEPRRFYVVLPPGHVYGVGSLIDQVLGRAVVDGVLLSPAAAAEAHAAELAGAAAAAARAAEASAVLDEARRDDDGDDA